MAITRRGILLGAGAAGGLLMAWALTPRRFAPPLTAAPGEVSFDAWLKIGRDGVVTVAVPESEMGQGITTLLPQIVAHELGADWRQIAVEPAPVSGIYANAALAARWAPLWMPLLPGLAGDPDSYLARRFAEGEAFVVAADGTSLAAYEAPARIAAASARAMLAMAAAARWDVGWETCDAAGGFISNGRRRLAFADLVDEAAGFTPPSPPVLRADPARERPQEHPAGASLRYPRLDLPAKVDGSYVFAGDVRLPDMVFAAIRHGPIGDSRLAGYDTGLAQGEPDLIRLVNGPGWLAAAGRSWWAAEHALSLITPRFSSTRRASSADIAQRLDRALRRGDAVRVATAGDPDRWLASRFEHTAGYTIAPALHATVETTSATARWRDDRLELWLASQAPQAARRRAADALGIGIDQVVLYPMPGGGSFDRRLETDHAGEVALIARELGRPVQLTWSRWQEHLAAPPRAPARAILAARTTPDGALTALKLRVAMPATAAESGARLFGGKDARAALAAQDQDDRLALADAVPPYGIDHLLVEHVPAAIALPTGRLRGNGSALACFLVETFVDELAVRAGREPLSYRIAMLGGDVALANVLQRAASLAEWNGGAVGTGQGVACHRMTVAGRTGRIAIVASARRDERGIRVDRISAVADIGRIINTDIARQQIEGGVLFGIGLARGCTTAYADGLPLNGRLGQLGLPALADCPDIEVEFVESAVDPFDPGELATCAVVPAIANALHAADGVRLRHLPLTAPPA